MRLRVRRTDHAGCPINVIRRRWAGELTVVELTTRSGDGLGVECRRRTAIGDDGGWTTKVGYGVCDSHAFAECYDAKFGFEEVDVQVEEDVACDLLL